MAGSSGQRSLSSARISASVICAISRARPRVNSRMMASCRSGGSWSRSKAARSAAAAGDVAPGAAGPRSSPFAPVGFAAAGEGGRFYPLDGAWRAARLLTISSARR